MDVVVVVVVVVSKHDKTKYNRYSSVIFGNRARVLMRPLERLITMAPVNIGDD